MLGASVWGTKSTLFILHEKPLYYILAFRILTAKMLLLPVKKTLVLIQFLSLNLTFFSFVFLPVMN